MDKRIDEAVIEAGLRAAADASDARLPRYKVVRAIIEAALEAAQQQGQAVACTCPSGDGSLRWPCPSHPPMQQGGGEVVAELTLNRSQRRVGVA